MMGNGSKNDDRNATLGDINGIYSVLNPLSRAVSKIEQKLDDLVIPKQPCGHLSEHLQDHKSVQKTISQRAIATVFDLGKMAVVALLTYYLVTKGG